jgi:cytochrome c peroxidase
MTSRSRLILGVFATAVAAACSMDGVELGEERSEAAQAVTRHGRTRAGKRRFDTALPETNGRACATCHVESQHGTLSPADVASRLAADPSDPLFNRIDADDPTALTPTFDHLKNGLVRVRLRLPDNVDLINADGTAVVTPADRTIEVWRGVPSIENVALTAPYQFDGRATTLEEQALGALQAHSEFACEPAYAVLRLIADFQKTVFSSPGVARVAELLDAGVPESEIPDPDPVLSPEETEGKTIFERACAACHGGVRGNEIVNRAVHDQLFFQLRPDGNLQFMQVPAGPGGELAWVPVLAADHEHDEFLNLGFAFGTHLTQIPPELGGVPNPTGLVFPQFRLRFYADGTRARQVTDLPPVPVFDPTRPNGVALDENGAPIVGPAFFPQWFSTDPGRALITGDPADFEAFDIPQLRGIARTSPYMHDNSLPTLRDVIDAYSRFIIGLIPAMETPPVFPPEAPGLPPEALSPHEKDVLVAYLNKL